MVQALSPFDVLNTQYSLLNKERLIKQKIAAINDIVSHTTPIASIVSLFPYLLLTREKPIIKSKIANVIETLMQQQIQFNQQHLFGYRFSQLYQIHIPIEAITSLTVFKEKLTLFGIASINYNGYVREEALKNIEAIQEQGEALPFILKLLNDHVTQVRTLASHVLNQKLSAYSLNTFIHYQAGFAYLNQLKFAETFQLKTKMYDLIRQNNNRTELFTNFHQYSVKERVAIIEILHQDIKKDSGIFDNIINPINPFIFKVIKQHFDASYFQDATLERLLQCKYPGVRRDTLLLLLPNRTMHFKALIYELLQDASINVRQTARYVLQDETINISTYYRELVKDPNLHAKPGTIMGFAENAQLEDIPLLKEYMTHSSKLVRTAIYANLYRLAGETVTSIIIKGLLDKSESVRALVVNIMRKSPENDDMVRTYFNEGNDVTKKSCFAILASRRSYQALNDILMAELINDKQHPLPIANKITIWTNTFYPKIYTPLSDDLYNDIMEKLKILDPKRERYYYLYPLLDLVHKK